MATCRNCGHKDPTGDWREENPATPGLNYYGQPVTKPPVEDQSINPINWTIDALFKGPQLSLNREEPESDGTFTEDDQGNWHPVEGVESVSITMEPEVSWIDRHAALHVRDCDMAASAAGCIYHPAPVNGFPPAHCTGYMDGGGNVQHDDRFCSVHEEIPTLRNNEFTTTKRKGNTMDDFIYDLRQKLETAQNELSEARDKQYELNDFIDGLEGYVEELDNYIDSLESAPEFEGSFDAEFAFDSSN